LCARLAPWRWPNYRQEVVDDRHRSEQQSERAAAERWTCAFNSVAYELNDLAAHEGSRVNGCGIDGSRLGMDQLSGETQDSGKNSERASI